MFAVLTRRTGSDRGRVSSHMSRLTVSKGKQPWRSAARLTQKPCTEARQLNLRLETSHGELIIRTLAQWILRPKRTKVDGDFDLSGEGARHPSRSARGVIKMGLKSVRASIAALGAFLCASTAFAQDSQGTPEQRAACAPDAFRFCGRYIPDTASVESCLRQQAAGLSDACRSVFEQSATQQSQMSASRYYKK